MRLHPRPTLARLSTCLAGLVLAAAPARAERIAPSADAPRASAVPSLADLARSFLRFEEALLANPPRDAERARIEVAFDEATKRFFFADLAGALRGIDELRAELLPEGADRAAAQLLASLRIELAQPVAIWREVREIELRLVPIYAPDVEDDTLHSARAVLLLSDGRVLAGAEIPIDGDLGSEIPLRLELAEDLVGPASGWLELRDETGIAHARARWIAADEEFPESARRLLAAAGELGEQSAGLERALQTFRARCALLERVAASDAAALVPLDPLGLGSELEAELALLRSGKDPYRGRTGELWRVLGPEERAIPLRLYVPPDLAPEELPPLVIALHGAGGNEHMFFAGYGGGLLARRAAERRFVLASPSTYPFARDPAELARFVDELARDVAFDPERVLVIGHSLGAMAAARIARERSGRVAKVCCLAGAGDFGTEEGLPPVLVILAELDRIVPAAPARSAVERARAADLPVELCVLAGRAHTLMVPDALELALPWLGLGPPSSSGRGAVR